MTAPSLLPAQWRLSIAPMMDWTDRHCRFFHRLITKNTLLYTEMVTTGALLHGDVQRHLRFNEEEHPVALQLGGSEAQDLAACAKLAERFGYDEVNLNCGCPSERVQRGAFGACLMAESGLVSDCLKAMQDVVSIPVTVKHRIGIDKVDSYEFVRDFVGEIYTRADIRVFVVHARSAWLKGLSPKENREIPPLQYDYVYRLKQDFPDAVIVLNGGVKTNDEIQAHLAHVDGVMLGREAYHKPWLMADWDARFYGQEQSTITRAEVEQQMLDYMQRICHKERGKDGLMYPSAYSVARHMLGLRHGQPGARAWKQSWSDQQKFRALMESRDIGVR